MLNTSIYGACIYIFCNPLLQNIIQVNCLTLYDYASVKVISKKKKKKKKKRMTPYLTPYAELGASHVGFESFHYTINMNVI